MASLLAAMQHTGNVESITKSRANKNDNNKLKIAGKN